MKTAAGTAPGPEVDDLDDTALLAAATAAERRDREAQRDKLRIAYQWCLRHPAPARPRRQRGGVHARHLTAHVLVVSRRRWRASSTTGVAPAFSTSGVVRLLDRRMGGAA